MDDGNDDDTKDDTENVDDRKFMTVQAYFCKLMESYSLIWLVQWWVVFFSSIMVVINIGKQLVYTHASIYSNLILFNDSKYMCHIWMTLHPIYQFQAKTGNNVSEFMYLNWIMLSLLFKSIKSLLPEYLIYFSHFCTQ